MFTRENLVAVLKDQGVWGIVKGLFNGEVWYLLDENRSHFAASGKKKIGYKTKETAEKSNLALHSKVGSPKYDVYRCLWCDRYHIGKTGDKV